MASHQRLSRQVVDYEARLTAETGRKWELEKELRYMERVAEERLALADKLHTQLISLGLEPVSSIPQKNRFETADATIRLELWRGIVQVFSLEEMETLAWSISVDTEQLGGQTKDAVARNLVEYAIRRNRLDKLLRACYELRPEREWPT